MIFISRQVIQSPHLRCHLKNFKPGLNETWCLDCRPVTEIFREHLHHPLKLVTCRVLRIVCLKWSFWKSAMNWSLGREGNESHPENCKEIPTWSYSSCGSHLWQKIRRSYKIQVLFDGIWRSEASQANYCKPREQKLVGGFMSLIVVPSTIGIVVARYRNPQDSHNQFAHPGRYSCIFLCGCPSLAHT